MNQFEPDPPAPPGRTADGVARPEGAEPQTQSPEPVDGPGARVGGVRPAGGAYAPDDYSPAARRSAVRIANRQGPAPSPPDQRLARPSDGGDAEVDGGPAAPGDR